MSVTFCVSKCGLMFIILDLYPFFQSIACCTYCDGDNTCIIIKLLTLININFVSYPQNLCFYLAYYLLNNSFSSVSGIISSVLSCSIFSSDVFSVLFEVNTTMSFVQPPFMIISIEVISVGFL